MRVHYKTFGCKANQYDTERMRQALESAGLATGRVTALGDADICVVNTCTVTNQADADARRFVRKVARENSRARIVVAGCSAALKASAYRTMPEIDAVVAGHDPSEVIDAVEIGRAPARVGLVQLGTNRPLDRIPFEGIGASVLQRRAGGTRGWLKIQDGCDRKCAFCATRLARGASRSREPEAVIEEARALSSSHPELVITGIHIGHYGLDLEIPTTLSRVVARLLDEVPTVRFRLGSIEATEVDDLLLDLLADSDGRLAPHLHMPLQSGADPVLRRMRRWHTREMYRSRALEIADRLGALGLGADVITGFPGETEEDHAATRNLIDELPFNYLHVFPYSPRDDTVAASLPNSVPSGLARDRARDLRSLADQKKAAYASLRGGTRAWLVLEGDGGTALTEDYLRVGIDGPLPDPNRLYRGDLSSDGTRARIDLSPGQGMN